MNAWIVECKIDYYLDLLRSLAFGYVSAGWALSQVASSEKCPRKSEISFEDNVIQLDAVKFCRWNDAMSLTCHNAEPSRF